MTSTQLSGTESPWTRSPRWRSLREAGPVTYDEGQKQWRVVDHQGVSAVLADPATYSSDLTPITPTQQDFETFRQGNFVGMDPPEHRKLRTLVSRPSPPEWSTGSNHASRPCARACSTVSPSGTGSTWSTPSPTPCRSS
ncbi:hypothetical protein ACR6C2_42295 [Streptomyces sp. INA 01156]